MKPLHQGDILKLKAPFVYRGIRYAHAIVEKVIRYDLCNDGEPYRMVLTTPITDDGEPFVLGTATFYSHEIVGG